MLPNIEFFCDLDEKIIKACQDPEVVSWTDDYKLQVEMQTNYIMEIIEKESYWFSDLLGLDGKVLASTKAMFK